MKTIYVKAEDANKKWYIIDAKDKILGRLAEKAANYLRGKHKPIYHPSCECGDYIVIINASQINVTGKKAEQKKYFWHTGYIGGIKNIVFDKLIQKDARRIIMSAIKGMLPRNKLGRKLLKNVKIYTDDKHPHQSQQPLNLEV